MPPRGARGSDWMVVRRCLALVERLQRGPASPQELVQAVCDALGPDAYPPDPSARAAAFKHDRDHLRQHLDADFVYDPAARQYALTQAGPFGRLHLSDSALRAVRLLSEAFTGQMGARQEVQALLQELTTRLSPADQRRLETLNSAVDLDLQQDVDRGSIPEVVWQTVERAVRVQRKLCFNYISPRHEDRLPRYHEAAPAQMRFQRGHWYLYAFDLYSRDPYGEERFDSGYKNFRVQYICADEKLIISPTRLPGVARTPPRYEVHYRLEPRLARGQISHHFENTHITRLPDGRAEVTATTDNLWEAAQVLLSYSDGCEVLGCPELRQMMVDRTRGMAAIYGLDVENRSKLADLPTNTDE